MNKIGFAILSLVFLGLSHSYAQVASDCVNAVPICSNTPINGGTMGFGIDDFNGASVSGCIAQATGTIETNSAWYHFRTGESGQLGFNIGFDAREDWDFALYRTDDCSNLGEPVRCNYFDNSDNSSFIGVGQDPSGMDNIQYEDWLNVAPNEDYYLLINNFSNNNSGFSIQFSGSIFIEFSNTALDCSIINNLLGPPVIACDNEDVILDATTIGAIGYEWYLDLGTGYQRIPAESGPTVSVAVSAMYRVLVILPSGNNIISETQVAFAPAPVTYELSDVTLCLDGTSLDLQQKDSEALGDQSADEFRVTYHTDLTNAINGTNALNKDFIPSAQVQTLYVRTTSLENNACYDASQSFQVHGVQVPVLNFDTEVYACDSSISVMIGEEVPDPSYAYLWDTGETTSQISVTEAGVYRLSVTNTASNLQCVSVRSVQVVFSRAPVIADIEIDYGDDLANTVTIIPEVEGDFEYQIDEETPQASAIFENVLPGTHLVTIRDVNGCGVDVEEIVVIGFPKYFSPNGDNVSDRWTVEGLDILENPIVTIYDRYGKLLYQLNQNSNGWDGTLNGSLLPEADYWFKLSYSNGDGVLKNAKYINTHFTLKR